MSISVMLEMIAASDPDRVADLWPGTPRRSPGEVTSSRANSVTCAEQSRRLRAAKRPPKHAPRTPPWPG
ncbi:hypothetical protein, partial [Nocardia abscessus]|uniref:hypothetical protein n=1 Tax=Nocardia abscessus TaxID=120957 RepID=UPI002455E4C8